MQVTEDGSYLLQTKMEKENRQRNVAIEYFRRNFPTYQVELKPDGHMKTPPRQPFPAVRNVPIFPDYEVGAGDKWVVEDVPFYPGGLVDEVNADWEYELIEFVKHNDFNTAHIKAKAKVDISLRPVTMAMLGFYGDPDREEKGAFIKELVPDSPALAAGLEPGDKILTIAGVKILDWYDIPELMPYLPQGEEVTIEYERSSEPGKVDLKTGTIQIAEVEGGGTFDFDIYFGVNRGHIISMDGKTNDLVLKLHSDKGEEVKNITSYIHMEFLPGG
jgi:membrane-associated protease RseP (regulator of RpoE activity)